MGEWLRVVVLLVAAVNPPRLAQAVSRRDGAAGPGPAAAVVVGGTVAAAALTAAAVLSGPLLDVLSLSPATAMVAAALVAIATGLHDLLRRRRPVETDAHWTVGLVPLAFPLILRPAAVLGAVAVGAADGAAAVVGGAVLAAGLAGTATRHPSVGALGVGVGRLLGALLVLLGVGLGLDGAVRV